MRARLPVVALVALLAGAGVMHFVAPDAYVRTIPTWLPAPRAWVWGSGVAELVCAAALAVPRTRRAGATATAALFVLVFPANVQVALDAGGPWWPRLAVQPLLVWWAWSLRR